MSQLKKAFLVLLPNRILTIIPLEEITNCQIITPKGKLGFWIYERTNIGGGMEALNDEVTIREFTDEDANFILATSGECYVETDYRNQLCKPRNPHGYEKVVIHIKPMQANFKLNDERWITAGRGPTDDSMFDCTDCLSMDIEHSIIRVSGPPGQGNKHCCNGDQTTVRRCSSCGAEDGPWVPA